MEIEHNENQSQIKSKTIEDIIKEGEELIPISVESDKKCSELHRIDNWYEMFYHIKNKKSKEKFISLISKSIYKNFFIALNYEYGKENTIQDISRAFNIYKNSAMNTSDAMSMYKMYHIYKNEYTKFGFQKRNHIFEKYFLYKSLAFLTYQEIDRRLFLCNRFDIVLEIALQFDQEDPNLQIFQKFMTFLKKYHKELELGLNEIIFIENIVNIVYKGSFEYINQLKDLTINLKIGECPENLINEFHYKLACFELSANVIEVAEQHFNYLINKKYYLAYPDYALFLYQKKEEPHKALFFLNEALENGVVCANFLYYDIFLSLFDFNSMKNPTTKVKEDLKLMFNLLINDVVTEGVFSYFEIFFFRKICAKHFGLKDFLDSLFFDYIKEFAEFIENITNNKSNEEENEENKNTLNDDNSNYSKTRIKTFFQRNQFYTELNLACGILYYYGIEGIVEKDILKSLEKFRISYKNSKSSSYRRFAYSYIFKIKDLIYKNKLSTMSIEKVDKSKKKIFNLYKFSVYNENFINLSSSFFYYFSRLLHKKIGNKGDNILEYSCLKKATDSVNKNPGTGSVICYYRKYKSIFMVKNEEFKSLIKNIKGYEESEGYGEDGSICPICFEKKMNVICLPCKHLFCEVCMEPILNQRKCPICRSVIITSEKI